MVEDLSLLRTSNYRHGLSFQNRMGRALWKCIEVTLFRWTVPAMHPWRRFLLRMFGAKLHARAYVYPTAKIWAPWNLVMEEGACLSWGVDCYCVAKIVLRKGCVVSQYARLIAASHDIRDAEFMLTSAPIEVGASAWVCAYSFVGMGVTVGEGAVVAATATAVRDVLPWTVVGGNPARFISHRESKLVGCA